MEKDIDDSSLEELESFEESFEEALEAAEQHGLFAAFKRGLSDWSPQSSDELLRASEQRLLKSIAFFHLWHRFSVLWPSLESKFILMPLFHF